MEGNANDLGPVLQKARTSRGFLQADVASELGVSRATIAQIETGRRSLKAEELRRLAAFYGCSPSELLAPATDDQEVDGVAELLGSYPDLAEDQGPSSFAGACAIARALTDLEARLEIDSVAHSLPSYRLERVSTPWQAARQGYRVAEDERRRLALGEGPVRFVDELLMTSGVRSAKATLPTGIISISIAQPDHGPLVVIDKNLGLEHRRFRYAHGLAHFLFDTEGPWRVCNSTVAPDLAEVRADAFASSLLMPQHGLRRYVETLGKETLGRAGPTVLSVFSEGDGRDKTGESRRVDGRQRRGRHPITLSDVLRTAHYYGTSPSVAAHRLRNLRLLTDRELGQLETMLHNEKRAAVEGELALQAAPHEMDSLCSRLAAFAASAFHRRNIDASRFNELADLAGVCVADRERLLAITAPPPSQEHESS
ncbi:MAG: ImmA/IrrE family metallo-endopeptidase [Deltaproteobacteria bacterium]|nr:ImmA/IrrE family metallo-endopeptidase [Deltaproteobacteria bacterium]MBW1906257.1 ImmA/IrrE family metallo-endopeptidase [Deltaproteobacteria bacterium]MBW2160530.1 ImmA/IrrE family metallo-endopeptidase [Deltaproteobacteria bacterium]MBW2628935.1 ImmA/IrrE family metallo-endopeptidase [Deltaproteobacteria bacterium]